MLSLANLPHTIFNNEAAALALASDMDLDDGETVHVLVNPKTGASWIVEVRYNGEHMLFV